MVNIHFVVTDFASHRTWIEGYQRYHHQTAFAVTPSMRDNDNRSCHQHHHDIRITFVPGDRWKFRMMAASADLFDKINMDDEILVVDAMLDATVLVALLKSNRPAHQCPSVLLYFHENQLTTPFTAQDRDVHKQPQHPTHWHYGMAHWRSLLVADGCIFNSQTHLRAFSEALPKCLNEQCPRDTVEWHLSKCHEFLESKCTVLPYGLELEELLQLSEGGGDCCPIDASQRGIQSLRNVWLDPATKQKVPVILWNARLEDDKNPTAFIQLLDEIKNGPIPFRLIILGTDPSKGERWYSQFREKFGDRILHMGWCLDRAEYASWLGRASIVVSTASHETFGISVVESVHCGALPLLPNRLSYPEIFGAVEEAEEKYLYTTMDRDGAEMLQGLLQLVSTDSKALEEAQSSVRRATRMFRWQTMGPIYDQFFAQLAKGDSVVEAGQDIESLLRMANRATENGSSANRNASTDHLVIQIFDPHDSRTQLFRPKSLRNQKEYNRQLTSQRSAGIQPALHGGRRAMVRMLEAIVLGAPIRPISFLTTPELAAAVLVPAMEKSAYNSTLTVASASKTPPIYIADKELLNEIRGQKLNVGDAILSMVQFPMESSLDELLSNPPILILENVRNAENVGSILRTAFCLGIRSVVASSTAWAALKDSRAARCSMGTMYYHRYFQAGQSSNTGEAEALVDVIRKIRNGGICVYGIEIGDEAKPVGPHGKDLNWAAVMGNEDLGLSTQVAHSCDRIVFIPQATGDSLNVGHAAAIAMFELGRDGPKVEHDGLAACT